MTYPQMYLLKQKGNLLRIEDIDKGLSETFTVNRKQNKTFEIHGVYGIIEFNKSEYLIVIKNAKMVGSIHKKPVYEVNTVKVIVIKGIKEYSVINFIYNFFKIPGMFFSEFDLSKKYNNNLLKEQDKGTTFLFNKYPLSIYSNKHKHFKLKCIQGYFGNYEKLYLISRRSPERAGVRYFSRGCNTDGYCSNFVETEQIIENNSTYFHLRGSIPFKWGHNLGLKYAPNILFSDENNDKKQIIMNQKKIFEKVDNYLKCKYRIKITYLNLIKEKGYEKKLFDIYKRVLNNVKAFHYDFHNKINKIPIPNEILKINEFSTDKTNQTEVIRTNCIDCLDRTNSMQFIIGKKILENQLDYFYEKEINSKKIENQHLNFLEKKAKYLNAFKFLFFENGNYLSIQYAGTPALLSTHILNNQLLIYGKLKDFYYSLARYWINRVQHGKLQTSYNILTGKFKSGKIVYHSEIKNILILIWLIFLVFSFAKNKNYLGKIFYFSLLILYIFYVSPLLIDLPANK